MTPAIGEHRLHLPRHAISPRQVARAGEIWRLAQDAAVADSTRCGWPPQRFVDEGIAFIVSAMTVRHHREVTHGETVHARTWVRDFRRGILSRREIRLFADDEPLSDATQQWVHVSTGQRDAGGNPTEAVRPVRASAEILACFAPVETEEAPVRLPEIAHPIESDGTEHVFRFRCWHTWMDPMAHANHPAYVDWCDEAIASVLDDASIDPQRVRPVAEQVRWRSGAVGGQVVIVRTRLTGRIADGAAVLSHTITDDNGQALATATTVRSLADGTADPIVETLR